MKPTSVLHNTGYSQLLFNEATDGIYFASPEGIYVAVNPSGHRILGYEDGELIGQAFTAVINPTDLPKLQRAMAGLAAGEIQTELWDLRCKDGKTVHIELRAQALSNGMLLGIVREPGARNEYERQVQTSEARLWSILQTAPDVILTVDRQGFIQFINRTIPPITMEQVLGKSCYDFVPAESRSRVQQAIEYVFATRNIDEYDVRGPPDLNGDRGWSSVRVGPMIKEGEVVAVTMCATDVTAYKRETARTQELLDRQHKIASMVPGMVFQFSLRADGSSYFGYASDYIRKLFNVSPDDARRDANSVFNTVHPDDIANIMAALLASREALTPIHQEFRVLRGENSVRWCRGDAAAPDIQQDGSSVWTGFVTDITERREADQRRLQLEEQLVQAHKMDSIGQLAGGVAHDFNNLLTAIIGFANLSSEELPGDTQVHSYLDGIKSAAARGAALTQQLVAFARKKIVRPENINLNDVLNRMAPMIRRLMGEHIDLKLVLAADTCDVKVDVGSIEQVLMNLIVNARDAMQAGGQLILQTQTFDLDSTQSPPHPSMKSGEYALLSVSDSGVGMSAEVQARLFEPFFTTKPPGAGTGLGLAMCHGIVHQAGGSIVVRSQLQLGTSFDIYLPKRLAITHVPGEVSPTQSSSGNETVLIVEDEPMILRLITSTLTKQGYRVLTANDGIDALNVANNHPERIHLLLTDVIMPRLGGKELAARMQQQHPAIKVLFMSGYAENSLAHQGELPEGINFIQKPYHPDELIKKVRATLDNAI